MSGKAKLHMAISHAWLANFAVYLQTSPQSKLFINVYIYGILWINCFTLILGLSSKMNPGLCTLQELLKAVLTHQSTRSPLMSKIVWH